jgi:hypothetical protein
MQNLINNEGHREIMETMRNMLKQKMTALNDTFESCTWYRDHWTDGNRNIIRGAKG